MKASLVICSRNRSQDLEHTLDSMLPSLHDDPSLLEILVVDNGSSDTTREIVERTMTAWPKLRYTSYPVQGLSRARNHGVSIALGDVLVWTDDDVRVDPSWLPNLLHPITSGNCECAVGRVEIAGHLFRDWMTRKHRVWLAENITPAKPCLVGANMAISRRALEATGRFDTSLGAGALGFHEETLLGMKLEKMGMCPAYVHDAVVIHHFHPSRLTRKSWVKTALDAGTSTAHVRHHWDGTREKMIAARITWHGVMLLLWRMIHPVVFLSKEGIDLREFGRIKTISYLRGMRRMNKSRPKNTKS